LFGVINLAYYMVPVTSKPNQKLSITVPVSGKNVKLNLKLSYNTQAGYWWITISDANNNILIDSLPLLVGQPPANNLLEQYQYLGIGSMYLVNNGNSALDSPDKESLGTDFLLLWGD